MLDWERAGVIEGSNVYLMACEIHSSELTIMMIHYDKRLSDSMRLLMASGSASTCKGPLLNKEDLFCVDSDS